MPCPCSHHLSSLGLGILGLMAELVRAETSWCPCPLCFSLCLPHSSHGLSEAALDFLSLYSATTPSTNHPCWWARSSHNADKCGIATIIQTHLSNSFTQPSPLPTCSLSTLALCLHWAQLAKPRWPRQTPLPPHPSSYQRPRCHLNMPDCPGTYCQTAEIIPFSSSSLPQLI
jgi:hypothetical protein